MKTFQHCNDKSLPPEQDAGIWDSSQESFDSKLITHLYNSGMRLWDARASLPFRRRRKNKSELNIKRKLGWKM